MGTYEITTDSGAVYQIDTEPSSAAGVGGLTSLTGDNAEPVPTTRTAALGALKGTAQAASDIFTAPADLLFRAGNEAIDYATGTDTNLKGAYPSDYRDRFLDYISGGEGDRTAQTGARTAGNIGTLFAVPQAAPAIASKVPILGKLAQSSGVIGKGADLASKAIGYGLEGAGYGALFGAKEDRIAEEAATGAGLNIAIPATLNVLGKGASKVAGGLKDEARRMLLKAFGAGKGRINKVIKKMPDLLDDAGEFQNPITDALEDFSKAGGGKSGDMNGAKLLSELQDQYDEIAGKLSLELTEAQTKQKDVIIPSFNATKNYIANLPGAQKKQAQQVASELIQDTVNNTDGTILSLQKEKQGLGKVIRETAWGEDAAGQLRSNIIKRIYADLRTGIEDGYEAITGKSGSKIKELNQQLGQKQTLFPIFEDMIASGEARTIIGSGIQSLRTSGGVGQTAIAAAAGLGAGGLPVGMAAVLGNMAIQSPRGMNALAKNLSDPRLKEALLAISKGATGAAGPSGRLAATFAEENPDRAPTDSSSRETTQAIEQASQSNKESSSPQILTARRTSKGASSGALPTPAQGNMGFLSPTTGPSGSIYGKSQAKEGSTVKTSQKGVNLIKEFEGYRESAYNDVGGIRTIGYGHTGSSAKKDKITKDEAEKLLKADLSEAERAVESLVEVPLKQGEFDALVSLVYNIGRGAFRGSTLLDKLNAGDKEGAAREFAKWNKAGGHEQPGLKRRRAAEKQLFLA